MKTRKTEIRLDFGAEITIALASDLHGIEKNDALDIIREARPDIICCPGDMFDAEDETKAYDEKERPLARFIHQCFRYTDKFVQLFGMKRQRGSYENALAFLSECAKIAPTYYSPGNHDKFLTHTQKRDFARAGVVLLRDSYVRRGDLLIGGISGADGDIWLPKFARERGVKLLLSHKPEHYPRFIRRESIQLTLSGHAHGGQWRAFGRGIFAPGQGLLPKYTHGEYEKRLVVSAGLANTSAFPRLNNPPEIVIIKSEK